MSLVPLKEFLSRAFLHIDRSYTLRKHKEKDDLKKILEKIIKDADFEYRGGVLVLFLASQVQKYQLHLKKDEMIMRINRELPYMSVHDIIFSGPRAKK